VAGAEGFKQDQLGGDPKQREGNTALHKKRSLTRDRLHFGKAKKRSNWYKSAPLNVGKGGRGLD